MACTQNTAPASTRGFIYDTIVKIDQLQKAATIQTACEGCEGSLLSTFYNTKPVVIYLCSGAKLTVDVPDTQFTTDLFRIENVKNDSVVLRLLVRGEETTCTNYTVVLNIDCICALQCLAPICCDACNKNCGA